VKILALDQALASCGYAVGDSNKVTACGCIRTAPGRFESQGMRFLKFERALRELIATHKPRLICFEEHRAHSGVQAAQVLGAVTATIMRVATELGIEYASFPVSRIKKMGAGVHNASKQLMLASARKKYPHLHIENDDVADAVAICALALATYSK
jgi:Holliday junction resolvasome RuvABC endonuclease subunit